MIRILRKYNKILLCILLILAFVLTSFGIYKYNTTNQLIKQKNFEIQGGEVPTIESKIEKTSRLIDVMNHPALADFGGYLFPNRFAITADSTIEDTASLLPYHSNVKPDVVTQTLNDMVKLSLKKKLVFLPVYSEQEIAADPNKKDVGILYFKGKTDAPFALIAPGGGFAYVGSIHEGFPYALDIREQGFNAFVLNYRVGNGNVAIEDLDRTLQYIAENELALAVNMNDYSLWGSSAGARMAAYIGGHGTSAALPQPTAVVMAYTGYADYTVNEPATFVVVGSDDGIASPRGMKRRIDSLQASGIPTEFHEYSNIGHGFGNGVGTSAEGWITEAITFWRKQAQR